MNKKKAIILTAAVFLLAAAGAAALLFLRPEGEESPGRREAASIESERRDGLSREETAGIESERRDGLSREETAKNDSEQERKGSEREKAPENGSGRERKEPKGEEVSENESEQKDGSGRDKSPETGGDRNSGKAGGVSDYGALQVIGSSLCDSRGNPVQLKGVSTHGLAWFPEYVNEALFRELREQWGANVVRLAMYTGEYGGYCTGGDREQLKQLIRDGVKYASDQDMYVIIDWHILSDGDPNTYKDEAESFFREMSAEFADKENVLYEICNEPNGGTSWSRIKEYAGEIIPIIRENDEDAVILVGTPNWSQYVDQAAADPVTEWDNIMYTLHFYAATHRESLRQTMTAALDGGLPIFVSEYSICDASGNGSIDEAQAEAWVETMDRYGVSYVAWNLSNKNETSSLFSASCSKTSGFSEDELSSTGKWLYGVLTRGAGLDGWEQNVLGNQGQSQEDGGNTQGREDQRHEDSGQEGQGNAGWIDYGVGQMFQGNQNRESQAQESSGQAVGGRTEREQTGSGENGGVEVTAGEGLAAEITLVNSWESNGSFYYQFEMTVENTSGETTDGWNVDVAFSGTPELSDSWNGVYAAEGNILHISSVDYNGKLDGGGIAENIGFIVSGGADLLS